MRIDHPALLLHISSEPRVSDNLNCIVLSASQLSDAAPDEPSAESEFAEDSEPITVSASTAESQQSLPVTNIVAEELSVSTTSQEETFLHPVSVSGGYSLSRPDEQVDVPTIETAQAIEDHQTECSSITR